MISFQLNGKEYIELNKLLKLINLVESGGMANALISNQEVVVNRQIETRKRKKLRTGDIIEFQGSVIHILE